MAKRGETTPRPIRGQRSPAAPSSPAADAAPARAIAPPDQDQRELVVRELDKNMLVEAAAGTGKTTCMVTRMVALLREGRCEIDKLVAVTFTRKSAAELRGRFQVALEKATAEATGEPRKRLSDALAHLERCFIGTIHSFCARLLRERPVEAAVDIAFEEMDEEADLRLRRQAWQEHVTACVASDDPIVNELADLAIDLGQLADSFESFAEYPDVDEWPAEKVAMPDLHGRIERLQEYARHMEAVTRNENWPHDYAGNDGLIPKYDLIPRLLRRADLTRTADVMELLEEFRDRDRKKIVQRDWPDRKEQAQRELDRWNDFSSTVAQPLVQCWREHRYEPVLRAIRPAMETYDRLRQASGQLNYQDLLMRAERLLRDKPNVRQYFRRRFTHLLVDEFQDTDPVQARVMLLLTAGDPREQNWQRCRPVPGSLFVVGDPKQSIYRFRRADIVTYDRVRELIEQGGGLVLKLSANFRTTPELIDWVNGTFEERFPTTTDSYSPVYVRLQPGRTGDSDGTLRGTRKVTVPEEHGNQSDISDYEATLIANHIRRAIDGRFTVPRSAKELEAGVPPQVRPEDFLIITRNTARMSVYAAKLQEAGIPNQVTGGSALNEVEELALLHACLRAVIEPHNALALVAVLRSPLFGVSDRALYTFRRAGGRFSFRVEAPAGLATDDAVAISDAFGRLREYAGWLATLPPLATIERMVTDLGLCAWACADRGGDVRAGSLAKALELLRAAQVGQWSVADLVTYLGQLVAEEQAEKHDGMSALPPCPAVRVMNLHKAKGLEAAVVFLADPSGESDRAADLHIDRAGDHTLGYMAIYGKSFGKGPRPILAQPVQWEKLADEEQQFQQAEKTRLLYVAATRAGAQLVITQRAKGDGRNPWKALADRLADAAVLEDPGRPDQPAPTESIAETEPSDAFRQIEQRWAATATRSYDVAAAKAISVSAGKFTGASEHGTEWGSVIHVLLEAAMRNPDSDFHALAAAAMEEEGLEPALAADAVATVQAVMRSEIWQRAQRSQRRLVEVPFQTLLSADHALAACVPTVLRGTIDLIFEEPAGWVIVDYKTDDRAGRQVADLVEHYRPQVRAYAEAWQTATGQRVNETGLFFTNHGQYVMCG